MLKFLPSKARGLTEEQWLKSYHSFSFGSYYDSEWISYGCLRVFNEDTLLGESGFNWHSHSNMEILTYVISGSLYHEDTLGNTEILEAGDFQLISSGHGIRHKELNLTKEPVHFYQIWFVPSLNDTEPAYAKLSRVKSRKVTDVFGDGGLEIKQDVDLKLIKIDGEESSYQTSGRRLEIVHVVNGTFSVNEMSLTSGDAMYLQGEYNFIGEGEILYFGV